MKTETGKADSGRSSQASGSPPVPGMRTRPMGMPMMVGAWAGLVNFCAGEAECLTEFKKTTGHDLTSVLQARGIDKMIDRATGHDLEVVAAFCDFVTKHAWGEEENEVAERRP